MTSGFGLMLIGVSPVVSLMSVQAARLASLNWTVSMLSYHHGQMMEFPQPKFHLTVAFSAVVSRKALSGQRFWTTW